MPQRCASLALHAVLSIYLKRILLSGKLAERIINGAERTVALRFKLGLSISLTECDIYLDRIVYSLEVKVRDLDIAAKIKIMLGKYVKHLVRLELLVLVVGYLLAHIAEILAHLSGQIVAVALFEQITDTALAGL